jgi:thiamine-monophosphate kinase
MRLPQHEPAAYATGVAEADFIERLRNYAIHPAARGLEGVHYLASDPPADVAWKLVAVNLSDLAAKGATPEGALLGYPLGAVDWDAAFADGLIAALRHFGVPLLGGDTVSAPVGAPRMIGLTAIGRSSRAPDRRNAQEGDGFWLLGAIGDAGAGLAIAQGAAGPAALLAAYRRPMPLLVEGRLLAPLVHAMADVSDGLLIDAGRIAAASGLAVHIDLDAIPRSAALDRFMGADRAARLAAATAGDDYALIAAAPDDKADAMSAVGAVRIGSFVRGAGISLHDGQGEVPLPARLGYQHNHP